MINKLKTVIFILLLLQLSQSLQIAKTDHQQAANSMNHLLTSTRVHQCQSQIHTDYDKNQPYHKQSQQKQKVNDQSSCDDCKVHSEDKNSRQQHLQFQGKCGGSTPVWNGKECKSCPPHSFFSVQLNFCVVCVPGTVFNNLASRCVPS